MVSPSSLDVFVVLFFGDFKGRWEQLHDVSMLETVRPVGGTITVSISHVKVDVFGDELLDELGMALSGCDMQAAEALLVLYLWIATTIQKLVNDLFHIKLGGQVHGGVTANVLIIGLVYLSLRL